MPDNVNFEITPVPGAGSLPPQIPPPVGWRRFINLSTVKTVLLLCGLLAVLAGLVFFFIRKPFNSNAVEFSLSGPTEAVAGQEITYILKYRNNTESALQNASVTLFYPPDSLRLDDEGSALPVSNEQFSIGAISPGQEEEREFKVLLLGEKGDIKNAKAILSYRPLKVASDFQSESTVGTTITSVPVSLTLVSPPNSVSGQKISYLLDYTNETGDDLTDLRLVFTYPAGFTPAVFEPSPTSGQKTWDVLLLKAGEKKRIAIQGILAGTERENKTVSVVLQRKINGQYIAFGAAESSTVITQSPLSVSLIVNDSRDYVSFTGDRLTYDLTFQNYSGQNLFGVTLSAKMEGTMFDFSTLDSGGSFNSAAKTITWDASSIPELSSLPAGGKGSAVFRIKLKDNFPSGGLGSKDFFVRVSVTAKTLSIPEGDDNSELTGKDELVTRISTSPAFDQRVFARTAPFGGNGPLPPKVGQKTAYTVYWKLINPGNAISNAKISSLLPSGVSWENKSQVEGTSASIIFNSLRKTVEWNIDSISARAGIETPAIEGYFQVSITPGENQAGSYVDLVKNSVFSGTDSFTQQAISLTVPDMDTSFAEDGGGTVQP